MPDESKVVWPVPHRHKNKYVAAARRQGLTLAEWIQTLCDHAVENDPDPVSDAQLEFALKPVALGEVVNEIAA